MKTAMWAVFIFAMGIVGIVLINIFGNITTTNQQDYILIKNTVEAAMMDSIDVASYSTGFYLCIKSGVDISKEPINFTSKDDYDIVLNATNLNIDEVKTNYQRCDYLVGEIKLNADVFTESFLRRFSENVNNNKSYKITVQEVIEYPPKVSVRIDTYNTYNSSDSRVETFESGDFAIQNQIDAILESKS